MCALNKVLSLALSLYLQRLHISVSRRCDEQGEHSRHVCNAQGRLLLIILG